MHPDITKLVEAHQWFQNGDHPLDNHKKATINESELVRRYRTPALDGQNTCDLCGYIMHDHGWIDTLEGGHIVCPDDWIIKDRNGKIYSRKPNIFKQTHEPVQWGYRQLNHD